MKEIKYRQKYVRQLVEGACTFKVSRHDSPHKVVAKAERMRGVMETKWNPRTRELTVFYDAKVTSPRHIMHFMA